MDDKRSRDNDAYDELLKSFSANSDTSAKDDDIKNHGEIYFSMNSSQTSDMGNSPDKRRQQTQRTPREKQNINPAQTRSGSTKKTSQQKKRKKKKNNNVKNSLVAVVIVVIVFITSFLIKIPIMGCINDILAIDVSNTDFRIVLDEDKDVFEVIDIFAEKNLINNSMFCKLFARLRNFDYRIDKDNNKRTIVYPAGTYFLNSSMGVEGMLNEIRNSGVESNTITLTFPEGYTIEQIVDKLDSNGVCNASSLYEAMANEELYEKYEFLSTITEKELRFRALEGYLYPDTYEFYIGESASSVIDRFLKNFNDKWTDTYKARAAELGYTVDEIITIATVLEKEAFDATQMPVIASVIYNRLNSSSFPFINCDSTAQYIENFKETLESSGKYSDYMKVYDTYQKTGLPVGPICCPGADAIHSALYPENTEYYYFLHAKDGTIYLSYTAEEHQNNINQYLN